jgi:hypothetical protein
MEIIETKAVNVVGDDCCFDVRKPGARQRHFHAEKGTEMLPSRDWSALPTVLAAIATRG